MIDDEYVKEYKKFLSEWQKVRNLNNNNNYDYGYAICDSSGNYKIEYDNKTQYNNYLTLMNDK